MISFMKVKIISLFFLLFTNLANAAPESFADLVEKLSPAVVSIASTTIIDNNSQNQIPQFPEGSPFDEFFKEYFDRDQRRSQRPMTGLGSGFIISDDGIIVTNNHVIEGADEITVILYDETEYVAELLGRDPKADLAVLKINPKNDELFSVNWGDSDKMRVGDWTIAIGNPLGLGGTVTAGIVSAISRDLGGGPYVKFLQTDASINRGNSGGPLFNIDGEVIGINTAIVSQTGGSIGLGFAIPANSAKKIVQQLKDFGKTKRGWLGVQIQPVTKDFAESLGLPDQKGAFVSNVDPNGPSKEAGLEAGDVILKFNNIDINKMQDLPRVVAESDVGSLAYLDIWRKNKIINLEVILGELPGEVVTQRDSNSSTNNNIEIQDLGITIINNENGVEIVELINENSDLEIGDIIKEVNRDKINDISSFKEQLTKLKNSGRSTLLLSILRDKKLIFISVKLVNN